ncbi:MULTISPECIES: hypothetical protein [Halomonadaceae]|uniref:Uncharacterized protein n=1 Tax=Vreelandella titanicae TaxID=664683 RepID=A0A558JAW4_9GAMM|nr:MULTISPECIES: hypothetical protein [Halomonas]MBR9904310.1 hypothetical protein [Gammaproteobacteria bacterium]TVU90652.1 hypothetical protein FQP89_06010 [Halomonas titanicae]CEP37197.1 Putative uncharacterized protein [Halomonas sp. R57-5]
MLNSRKEQNLQRHVSLPCGDKDGMPKGSADDSLKESIPSRYCDGRGGINLERVRLDQHEARRQVIQSMIRHLQQVWSR